MKRQIQILITLTALGILASVAVAQPTAFTYQGRLGDGATPANGTYDLRFSVWTNSSGPAQVGVALTISATTVSNGFFTVSLDFGAGIFTGEERWLEIGVRTNGGGAFATLNPRQRFTSTPYAITAGSVTGVVPNASLAGTYSNAVTFNNAANQFTGAFTGNGGGLSNVNAQTVGGFLPGSFWQLSGNNVLAGQFLGSTNAQALVLKVNGQDAMRYEPTFETPNVVGGWSSNYVLPGLTGVTIGGGGSLFLFNGSPQPNVVTSNGYYGTIAGGYNNTVQGYGGVVAGGSVNSVIGDFGFIGGGQFQLIDTGSGYSVIGGGFSNSLPSGSAYSTIGGGAYNSTGTNVFSSTVAGGYGNVIRNDSFNSAIGGGYTNVISTNSPASVIAGGVINIIGRNSGATTIGGGAYNYNVGYYATVSGGGGNTNGSSYAVIAGGLNNVIRENVDYGFIGGGNANAIQTGSGYSVIAGGFANAIETNAGFSVIGGGLGNSIQPFADQSVVAGGNANRIVNGARESFIGGGFANTIQTNATGSFIGGGAFNTNTAYTGFIGSGQNNFIGGASDAAAIVSGTVNSIGTNSGSSAIGGGSLNRISDNSGQAAIAGGWQNSIGTGSIRSVVAGGWGNSISNNSSQATIGGGFQNRATNNYATVGGGYQNLASGNANGTGDSATVAGGYQNAALGNNAVVAGGYFNLARGDNTAIGGGWLHTNETGFGVIGGGQQNRLESFARFSVISGGDHNTVSSNSTYSVISGGSTNRVGTNAPFATILGGYSNAVTAPYGTASGRRAKANHQGSFVWADSQDADFASTTSNQFNIRAMGGLRLETLTGSATLNGQPILSGTVPGGSLAGNYSNAVTFSNAANIFAGNGGSLSNVNAATLGGLGPSSFWKTTGNAGTVADVNFLGTTDAQPLDIHVAGTRALRIDPGTNYVPAFPPIPNIIGGSPGNFVVPTSVGNVIAGGGEYAELITNYITGFNYNSIGGGWDNHITNGFHNVIAGGEFNTIGAWEAGVIGGGNRNTVTNSFGAIGGGEWNTTAGYAATVPGGQLNVAGGDYSFAAGRQAKANHQGSFVWADSTAADFASTINDQFLIRATGGVGIGTTSPQQQLSVQSGMNIDQGDSNNGSVTHGLRFGSGSGEVIASKRTVGGNRWGLDFYTDFKNRMTILNTGNIGIGTTNPVRRVQVGDASVFGSEGMIRLASRSSTATPNNRTWECGVPQTGDDLTGDGYCFVIRDADTAVNRMVVRWDTGFVGIGLNNPTNKLHVAGGVSATAFVNTSDRNAKENFKPISAQEILAKVATLPITKWNFKEMKDGEHLGPMAQDFYAAFGLGGSDKTITTSDEGGVALAAIQGLNQKLEEREAVLRTELTLKEKEIAALKQRLDALEEIIRRQPAN
jgi:hypothetical protein